ncbi:MAG: VOC family protein, partial [Deltaproteobacteria bacterium]|nr:VOC family protein [Deltaproteobacteria bacterium]
MLKKINHIGIVVNEFEQAITKFKEFGLACTEIMEFQEIGVKIAFFTIGDVLLELLYFTRPDNKEQDTATAVVRAQKGTINHISFEV